MNRTRKLKEGEKLRFRRIGSGFIMAESIDGLPAGRKLAKTFSDQFDRLYVQVGGKLEQMSERHSFLAME